MQIEASMHTIHSWKNSLHKLPRDIPLTSTKWHQPALTANAK